MFKKLLSNTVFKNFSYLTISTVLSQLISLITVLKITSILNPDDYGLYTFLIAQGMLLLKIGDLGNSNIVIRTIAREPHRTNDLLFNGAILRTFAIIALFLLYLVYNHFLGSLSTENLALIFLFTIISCLSQLSELVFLGNQKMFPSSMINLTFSLTWFLIIMFLPEQSINVTFIFLLYIVANFVKTLLYFICLKQYKLLVGPTRNFFTSSKALVVESWPYFAIVLILLPLTSFSVNFLDLNSTDREIGYFNLALRLIGPLSLVIGMLLTAIFPHLSQLYTENKEKFRRVLSKGFGFYMISSILFCFMFTMFCEEVVTLLFPDGYLPAVKVSQMQVWYLFFTSIDSFIGAILGAANKEKLIVRFSLLYLFVCGPTLYFTSFYGALGLSYGYVISYGLCFIYVWYTFNRTMQITITHSTWIWILAIGLFAVSYFVSPILSIPYKILISLAVMGALGPYLFKLYKPLVSK